MLETEVFRNRIILVQKERADGTGGHHLGGERHRFLPSFPVPFGSMDSVAQFSSHLLAPEQAQVHVFPEFVPDGGFIRQPVASRRHHGIGDAVSDLAERQKVILFQNIQKDEMESDIHIRKALRLPRAVQRVMGNGAVVHRDVDALPGGILVEGHVVAQPALHPSALVVVAAGAFLIEFGSGAETIDIEFPHVFPDLLKVLDQFAVGHGLPPFLLFVVLRQ